MGGCAGDDVEVGRDFENQTNTVEFPVMGNILYASIASELEGVGVVTGAELLLVWRLENLH